jgi:2-succinyl-6-hydroxy-2,4-cyclohexadiene-1-carboxylate synthase
MTTLPPLTVQRLGRPTAPAIVWLHGFLGQGSDWGGVAGALADRWQSVLVDLPGHGGSRFREAPTGSGVGQAARAVLHALDAAGIGQAHLVGYSLGGRVALRLLALAPERWRGIVLESASPGLADAAERRTRRAADLALAGRLATQPLADFLRNWYAQPLFASLAARPELLALLLARRAGQDAAQLAWALAWYSVGRQAPLWPCLPRLPGPALLLAGELDPKYCAAAHRMAATWPAARVAILTGCGHNTHLENPTEFQPQVAAFLAASEDA